LVIRLSNINWPESFTGTALLQKKLYKQTRRATFAGRAADSEKLERSTAR
jgi:hypothetical protein